MVMRAATKIITTVLPMSARSLIYKNEYLYAVRPDIVGGENEDPATSSAATRVPSVCPPLASLRSRSLLGSAISACSLSIARPVPDAIARASDRTE